MKLYAIWIINPNNVGYTSRFMRAERPEDLIFNPRMPEDVTITVIEIDEAEYTEDNRYKG